MKFILFHYILLTKTFLFVYTTLMYNVHTIMFIFIFIHIHILYTTKYIFLFHLSNNTKCIFCLSYQFQKKWAFLHFISISTNEYFCSSTFTSTKMSIFVCLFQCNKIDNFVIFSMQNTKIIILHYKQNDNFVC